MGRTTKKLHNHINKHQANIKKKFMLHGLSRHCASKHPDQINPFVVLPIDILICLYKIGSNNLKKSEIFWMCRLKTLHPLGLDKIAEVIIE